MAREILDLKGLCRRFPFTRHQVYKMTRRADHPLPYKKAGKKLLFDLERVYRWFDGLPGKDETFDD